MANPTSSWDKIPIFGWYMELDGTTPKVGQVKLTLGQRVNTQSSFHTTFPGGTVTATIGDAGRTDLVNRVRAAMSAVDQAAVVAAGGTWDAAAWGADWDAKLPAAFFTDFPASDDPDIIEGGYEVKVEEKLTSGDGKVYYIKPLLSYLDNPIPGINLGLIAVPPGSPTAPAPIYAKGLAGGVAPLDETGKVPLENLPDSLGGGVSSWTDLQDKPAVIAAGATEQEALDAIGAANAAATAAALATKAGAVPHFVGPAFMVIGATDAGAMATAKANGATHVLVQAPWDALQTTAGGAVDATSVIAQISAAKDAGLLVCFEAALQYPPDFVKTGAPKFKDQSGTEWDGDQGTGDQIRDWIWSATGRDYVEDYLSKLFTALPWENIERVRLGGGQKGELQFPGAGATAQWWSYSDPAQTGVGIASGMTPAPTASHVPSSGTTWTDDDEIFYAWYRQSMNNWMTWLIGEHRKFFAGAIWVLHPGAGLRPVSQTPTSTDQAANWRINASKGLDWDAQIAAYPDPDVWPYSTWVDSQHFWAAAWASDVNDGNAAPWYQLLRTAKKYARSGRLWGENTGGQTNADMDRVFQSGAIAYGYEGIAWLNHASLSSGTDDTYANFLARTSEVLPGALISGSTGGSGGNGTGGAVASVNGKTGDVTLTKANIGLGNVDNTADTAKPISTAQAQAIAAKYTKPGTGVPKTDLETAVQASLGKADSALQSVTKATVGLGNVDNTADAAKPVSTAQAAALATKADLDSGGKIPAAQLPSYVDDVLEFANSTAFPQTGESGKIYIALDTRYEWRWSGSTYVQLVSSPGSTDAVPEGSTNKYFTDARAVAANQATADAVAANTTALTTRLNFRGVYVDGTHYKINDAVISPGAGLWAALQEHDASGPAPTSENPYWTQLAGASNLALGTDATTAKPGSWEPAVADITDAGAQGQVAVKAVDVAGLRAAFKFYELPAGGDESDAASAGVPDKSWVLIPPVLAATFPTLVGYATTNVTASGTTAINITPDASCTTGMTVFLAYMAASSATPATPDGFELVNAKLTVGTRTVAIWKKTRASGDGAYTVNQTANGAQLNAFWLSGANPTLQVGAGALRADNATDTSCKAPSITTTAANVRVLVLSFEATVAGPTTVASVTGATPWFFAPEAASPQVHSLSVSTIDMPTAGATGDVTVQYDAASSSTANGYAIQIGVAAA